MFNKPIENLSTRLSSIHNGSNSTAYNWLAENEKIKENHTIERHGPKISKKGLKARISSNWREMGWPRQESVSTQFITQDAMSESLRKLCGDLSKNLDADTINEDHETIVSVEKKIGQGVRWRHSHYDWHYDLTEVIAKYKFNKGGSDAAPMYNLSLVSLYPNLEPFYKQNKQNKWDDSLDSDDEELWNNWDGNP